MWGGDEIDRGISTFPFKELITRGHLVLTGSTHKDLVPQGDSSSPAGMDPHRQWFNQGPFFKGDIVRKPGVSFNTLS